MDYKADQARVPYVLDQFSQLWKTPFSPLQNLIITNCESLPAKTSSPLRYPLRTFFQSFETALSGTETFGYHNTAYLRVYNKWAVPKELIDRESQGRYRGGR